jgi:FkbM family methyltransferase
MLTLSRGARNIGWIATKSWAYSREATFVLRNSLDWRTRVVLLKNLARFHASHIRGRIAADDLPFRARLRLAPKSELDITVRTFSGDLFILLEVLMDRCYHIPDTVLPPEKVRVILDCGANIGLTSLYFASRYPSARIFSVEPSLDNFQLLKCNVAAEPRIVPVHGALVGRERDNVRMTTHKPAWGNFIVEDDDGVEVPAFTVDQIMKHFDLSCIDLLKVDIEGGEKEVFANGHFISQVGLVIVELHDDYHLNDFARDVANWGFQAIAPEDRSGSKMIMASPPGSAAGVGRRII